MNNLFIGNAYVNDNINNISYVALIAGMADQWRKCQADADEFFAKGLAKSTLKSYQSGIRRYKSFCTSLGRPSIPITEDTLAAFVAVSRASRRVYLSALRHHQIESGHGDPGIPRIVRLEYILKGIKRDNVQSSNSRKDCQPITPSILSRLFSVWEGSPDLRDAKMLWAAACLAFFGFLRVGEFTAPGVSQFDEETHLSVTDVSVNSTQSPSMVFIRLKQSKTDQWRKGITIILGRTNKSPLCPVSSLLSYIVVRGMAPGPLFIRSNGHFLTRTHFVAEVKKAMEQAGMEASNFNGHSFRIGAASTAAVHGMEDSLIKTLGRWESDAYQRYIKIPREELANYTVMLTS